jgi:hypothetical protein
MRALSDADVAAIRSAFNAVLAALPEDRLRNLVLELMFAPFTMTTQHRRPAGRGRTLKKTMSSSLFNETAAAGVREPQTIPNSPPGASATRPSAQPHAEPPRPPSRPPAPPTARTVLSHPKPSGATPKDRAKGPMETRHARVRHPRGRRPPRVQEQGIATTRRTTRRRTVPQPTDLTAPARGCLMRGSEASSGRARPALTKRNHGSVLRRVLSDMAQNLIRDSTRLRASLVELNSEQSNRFRSFTSVQVDPNIVIVKATCSVRKRSRHCCRYCPGARVGIQSISNVCQTASSVAQFDQLGPDIGHCSPTVAIRVGHLECRIKAARGGPNKCREWNRTIQCDEAGCG